MPDNAEAPVAVEHTPALKTILCYLFPLAAGLYLASPHWADAIWYDESYTLIHFATGDLLTPLTNYSEPNNHPLFSLLLALWIRMGAGDVSILFLRSLPLITFLLATGFVIAAGNTLAPSRGGWWCGLFFVTSHVTLNFALQLRGYGPSWLPIAIAWWALAQHGKRPRIDMAILYALCASVAVGMIPTNVIPFTALACWGIVAQWRSASIPCSQLIRQSGWLLLAPLAGGIWYLGIWRELLSFAGSYETEWTPLPFLQHVAWAIGIDLLYLAPALAAGLIHLLLRLQRSSREPAPSPHPESPSTHLVFLLCVLLTPVVFILAMTKTPFPRTLVPMLPLWCGGAGLCLAELIRAAQMWRANISIALAIILSIAIIGLGVFREQTGAGFATRHPDGERPQNLYDLYYHHGFAPQKLVATLHELATQERLVAVTDGSDLFALQWILLTQYPNGIGHGDSPFVYYRKKGVAEALARSPQTHTVLLVSHHPNGARQMGNKLKLRPNTPWTPHEVADTGFFKIYVVGPGQTRHQSAL